VARAGHCEKQNYWSNRQGEFKTPHGIISNQTIGTFGTVGTTGTIITPSAHTHQPMLVVFLL
jgi:hypothetical protein